MTGPRVPERRERQRLTIAACVLLGLPAAILLFMGIGEMADGEVSGAQHIPEAAALIGLMLAAWWFPRVVGILLLMLGSLVFAGWLVLVIARGEFDAAALLVGGVVVLLPPLVAGWLLLKASTLESE
jgi:cytochrome bd-type quinol oxidase subunit 1